MNKVYRVTEELVYYDPALRSSWTEGGPWPHRYHYGFHEAVVAAHFRLRGYEALHDYNSMKQSVSRLVRDHYTQLFHDIVGESVSAFLTNELAQMVGTDYGQPDLFVFREEHPNDPNIHFPDELTWFFVEVKGPGEDIRDTQSRYWRRIADREDLDLGPKRIRLYRALPEGTQYKPQTFDY